MPCVCAPSEWIIINSKLLSRSKQFSTCRPEIPWILLASKYSNQMNAHLKRPSQGRVALSCQGAISLTPSSYNCKFSSCKIQVFFSLLDSKPKKSIGNLWKLRAYAIYQTELGTGAHSAINSCFLDRMLCFNSFFSAWTWAKTSVFCFSVNSHKNRVVV